MGVSSQGAYVDARQVDWGSELGPNAGGADIQGEVIEVVPWEGFTPHHPASYEPPIYQTDSECADVVVFGVRGSGETPQAPNPYDLPTFDTPTHGFGLDNLVVAGAIQDRVHRDYPDVSIKLVPIRYRALAVKELISYPNYFSSIDEGGSFLADAMEVEMANCAESGTEPIYAITAYSQGALSTRLALSPEFPGHAGNELTSLVAGIAFVGDPGRVSQGEGETLWETDFTPAQAEFEEHNGILVLSDYLAGTRDNADFSLRPELGERTISMCHLKDPVCAKRAPGSSFDAHTKYSAAEDRSIGLWVGTRVVHALEMQ